MTPMADDLSSAKEAIRLPLDEWPVFRARPVVQTYIPHSGPPDRDARTRHENMNNRYDAA